MPRGFAQREQLAPKVQAMRAEGMMLREIAEHFGLPISTVHEWCSDPDRQKHRARRMKYAGVCSQCGKETDGSGGPGRASDFCQDCREWSDEAIIAAIQDWAEAHGGVPPTITDWRLCDGSGSHPSYHVVVVHLGWNNALLKAGFDLKCDRRPETQAEMERMIRAGVSTQEIADHFGWTVGNVHMRLRTRGTTVTALREAA